MFSSVAIDFDVQLLLQLAVLFFIPSTSRLQRLGLFVKV